MKLTLKSFGEGEVQVISKGVSEGEDMAEESGRKADGWKVGREGEC